MNKDYIQTQVTALQPWYQSINFDGIITTQKQLSGERFWKEIKKFLPDDLKGKRILDLGCNAGYYCISSALLNCKEVIGIESNTKFFKQAEFTKTYFEEKYNRKFDNVKYIKSNISFVNFLELGTFDYVLAIAVLYHIGKHQFGKYSVETMKEQTRIINILTKISPRIIVRSRRGSKHNMQHYNEVFSKFNFKNLANFSNSKGSRALILYGK